MSERIDLVRDVLDKLLRDENGRECGRVDGVVIHLRQNGPPRVGEIQVSVLTALERVHRRLGPLLARWVAWIAPVPLDPISIPLDECEVHKSHLKLDLDAEHDRRFMRFEKWLRTRFISKI